MIKKVYVGNLAPETTEADLKDLFMQCGNVEWIRIVTDPYTGYSKGFAFIEMSDGADQAIALLNGREINGRPLRVNTVPRKEKGIRRL